MHLNRQASQPVNLVNTISMGSQVNDTGVRMNPDSLERITQMAPGRTLMVDQFASAV